MKILVATSNLGKLSEILEFLKEVSNISFLSLSDLDFKIEAPEEDGKTFIENASIKARYYFEKTGIPTLAEDSGIEVDALKGELGIKTRRWGAGETATDDEWISFFLERMKNEKNRNARFFSAFSLIFSDEEEHTFEGTSEGVLLESSSAPLKKGIPLSSYFLPNGYNTVFSELDTESKNNISHRGRAIKGVKNYLLSL